MFSFNLFGKKPQKSEQFVKVDNITKTIDVISKLRGQVESLEKRNNYTEVKINKLVTEIKIIANTDKKKALILLNRKNLLDQEVKKNTGMIDVIERQIISLENASVHQQVFKSMQEGNIFIKSSNANINVDKVEDLMDEIDEQKDASQAISDIFSQRVDRMYEDDDLLAQLDEYTEKELTEPINITNIRLPEVSNNKIIIQQKNEDQEEEEILNSLVASM
jgi:hypothetical protein